MRRVGMMLKRDEPEALAIAGALAAWLVSHGHLVITLASDGAIAGSRAVAEDELAQHIDLLLVLGGDGTLLRAAALVAERGVPLLGVNLGHLGFLTSCAPADAQTALERALAGELPIEERMRLRCVLHRASGEEIVKFACNDAVVSQGALARLIELDASIDDTRITRYKADGLIVSTPTGSTAYSLAAGGPILTPDLRAMVITPICPHTLTNRPVVAPASSRIRIQLAAPADHVLFTIDGQWGTNLQAGDRVDLEQASAPLCVYRPAGNYFDVLREKLSWGEREG